MPWCARIVVSELSEGGGEESDILKERERDLYC